MQKTDVYQIVTDRIIAQLEAGVVPWRKPWVGGAPQNLASKKEYRGVNVLLLAGGETSYWVTYKQAQALGGQVRRGEKGLPVVYWQIREKEDPETGEIKTIPLARYYTVFNAAQCDGIQIPPSDVSFTHNPIKTAQTIIDAMPNRPIIKAGANATYSPSDDVVTVPPLEKFFNAHDYYSTLFHELGHSTMHPSRLNREHGIRYGSMPYAKEELVAEMTAAFLCGNAGISPQTIDNSAAYIANWLLTLSNDRKMIISAASQAQKAADYIVGKNMEQERLAA